MAPPTGTLASAIKALPAGADPGATGEAAAEVGEAAAGVLEPPQAASPRALAPRPAATSTWRRDGVTAVEAGASGTGESMVGVVAVSG